MSKYCKHGWKGDCPMCAFEASQTTPTRKKEMKIVLEFTIGEQRDFDNIDLMDYMAGEMSAFDEFEGADVSCKILAIRTPVLIDAVSPDPGA